MTNEFAIKVLTELRSYGDKFANIGFDRKEALEMAIKALEQTELNPSYNGVKTELEPCEDCISRQAVLDIINFEDEWLHDANSHNADTKIAFNGLESRVKELPSVTPQPKTGHWEYVQYDYNPDLGNWHCSECRNIVIECINKNNKGGIPIYKYCPNCGAKMVESEE